MPLPLPHELDEDDSRCVSNLDIFFPATDYKARIRIQAVKQGEVPLGQEPQDSLYTDIARFPLSSSQTRNQIAHVRNRFTNRR